MQAVDVTRASGVEVFLVIVQIEAIEVDALAAFDLRDPQNLPALEFERLAGPRLEDDFAQHFAFCHVPLLP